MGDRDRPDWAYEYPHDSPHADDRCMFCEVTLSEADEGVAFYDVAKETELLCERCAVSLRRHKRSKAISVFLDRNMPDELALAISEAIDDVVEDHGFEPGMDLSLRNAKADESQPLSALED